MTTCVRPYLLPTIVPMNSSPAFRSPSVAGLRALFIILCLSFSLPIAAQPAPDSLAENPRQAERSLARSMMDNPRNPLLEIVTPEGDLYLELFQEAAPRNTAFVLELAQESAYDDGLGFTATGADLYIGLTQDTATSAPDEINGRGLGLEQQPLLDAAGRPHPWLNVADERDFQHKVLVPLYRSMGISDRAQLESQQDAVMRRLQQMNLMQVYETMGYRYNAQLASRRPVSNSVLMSNHGPGTNNGGLVITLADTPWLTGTHTVVGRLVSGQSIVRLISRQPPDSIRIQQLQYVDESP